MIEVIEPLEVCATAKLHCPCGAAYGPPKPGETAERVTLVVEEIWGMMGFEKDHASVECIGCGRTFRLICRVEAEK